MVSIPTVFFPTEMKERRHLFGLDVAEHGDLLLDRVLKRRRAAAHDLKEQSREQFGRRLNVGRSQRQCTRTQRMCPLKDLTSALLVTKETI